MKIIDVLDATADLATLLSAVESGEEILISREGQPVARLSKFTPIHREPGVLSHYPEWRDWKYDPLVFAPLMTDDELAGRGLLDLIHLADACALIVFLGDPMADATMPEGTAVMRTTDVAVLATTVWEITRKAAFGKLPRFWGPGKSLTQLITEHRFKPYPLSWDDAEAANQLPDHHRDPMDRLLIAVAMRADMTVITSDRIFRSYGVRTLW